MPAPNEVYVSVDVETAGSIPGEYSMLKVGACLADEPERAFACTIRPINGNFEPGALAATGLTLEECERDGLDAAAAMSGFAAWVAEAAGPEGRPVFVALNAPFDWSFVNWYFLKYLGENPFGFTALDVKALYMGRAGCRWDETRSSLMDKALSPSLRPNHDALQDARYQAELFRLVRGMPAPAGAA